MGEILQRIQINRSITPTEGCYPQVPRPGKTRFDNTRRGLVVLIVAVICAALAACSGSSGSSGPSKQEMLQSVVDSNWSQYRSLHSLPDGGVNIYIETPTGNYFASSNMPADTGANTHFRIASNTKSFTSAAILLLYQQGKLGLDDIIVSMIPGKVIPYVPNTPAYDIPYKSSITIRQLMNHTAGVFDVANEIMPADCPAPYAGKNYVSYVTEDLGDPNRQFSPEELISVDAVCNASYFEPGRDYKYSNTGYSLLAVIIERVSGLTYDQFILQNLITPNSLRATSVPMLATDQTIPSPFADGYFWYEGVFETVTEDNVSEYIAEGNIISTPADLARWIRRLIRAEAGLDSATIGIMKTASPQSGTQNYGCGIHYTEGLGYGHTGATIGYLSVMMHDPTVDVTVIAYFNVWDYPNLVTDQSKLLFSIARDARRAVGY